MNCGWSADTQTFCYSDCLRLVWASPNETHQSAAVTHELWNSL
jgi:hypothetical protein